MPLRILFIMKHAGTSRNFEGALRILAERGHDLRIVVEAERGLDGDRVLARLSRDHPNLGVEARAKAKRDRWTPLKDDLRHTSDFLRYLEPRYARADKLRERARPGAPATLRRLEGMGALGSPAVVAGLGRAVRYAERVLPPSKSTVRFLADRAPDVVLVSPLVGLGSRQADIVRAARWLRTPSVLPVFSWDNLTNKGLLRDAPDLVTVWNEPQAREAEELHRVPRERIEVTGATAYDHWFSWGPTRDRASFCRQVGLPPERPLLLYVCSSPFIAPDEVGFVRRWLAAVRSALDPRVAEAGVLIRPHPQHARQWRGVTFDGPNVVVWPAPGAEPVDVSARADLYDSIHHASAVVGINTSAQIESAILERPVLTVLDAEFTTTQEGTLHFHHLAAEGHGMLTVAGDLERHAADISAALEPTEAWRLRNRRFVETFVRPHGLDQPASPRLADAVERAAASPAAREDRSVFIGRPLVQRALRPVGWQARRRHASAAQARLERRLARTMSEADPVDEAMQTVAELCAGTGPVIAGPFTSEVGYELLYWIPFLRRALERNPALRDRLVVLSRGGSAPWYADLGVAYLDLFDEMSPEALRRRLDESSVTGGQHKQMVVSDLDTELLATAARSLGTIEHGVLHPSVMYRAFWALVKRRQLLGEGGERLMEHRRLAAPEPSPELAALLPGEFVAARFYFRPSLPDHDENRMWIAESLRRLAERVPVVLLNPALQVDDHWDFEAGAEERVIRVDHLMRPADNLAVQTAVIARARCFVGTYGGLAYLPPLLGVPSWSFHSEGRFKEHHLSLARRVFARPGFGAFRVDRRRAVNPTTLAARAAAGQVHQQPTPVPD